MPNFRVDYVLTEVQGERIEVLIPNEIEQLAWNPSQGKLPVDAATAYNSARSVTISLLRDQDLSSDDWNVTAIDLVPYDEQLWFWRIRFEKLQDLPSGSGYLPQADRIEVAVLMNGNTIAPQSIASQNVAE